MKIEYYWVCDRCNQRVLNDSSVHVHKCINLKNDEDFVFCSQCKHHSVVSSLDICLIEPIKKTYITPIQKETEISLVKCVDRNSNNDCTLFALSSLSWSQKLLEKLKTFWKWFVNFL